MRFKLALLCAIALSGVCYPSYAKSPLESEVVEAHELQTERPKDRADKEIPFSDIENFIRVSISESNWQEAVYGNTDSIASNVLRNVSSQKKIREYLPILSEYVFRENGVPPTNVVNKWPTNKVIRIGFGWPKFLQPYSYGSRELSESEKLEIENALHENISIVKKASGLSIEFVKEEDIDSFGSFRILFVKSSYFSKGSAKLSRKITLLTQRPLFHEYFEPAFIGAVPFSSSQQYGVDGYILPSSENEIEVAVCYLNADQVFNNLFQKIQECLLRGLGLPDSAGNLQQSILSSTSKRPEDKDRNLMLEDKKFLNFMYRSNITAGDNYWEIYNKLNGEKDE